jgi:hypothetical protein
MMNQPSTFPLHPAVMTPAPRWRSRVSIAGLSLTGILLFITGVFVTGSGFLSLRPDVFGLRLHPYLIPVAIAFLPMVLTRIQTFPVKILVTLLVFTGIYFLSVFNGAIAIGEIVKLGSAVVTVVTCALLVRRRGDFVAGVLGLSISAAALAYNGLTVDTVAGVEAVEGANKNSYSLFALPAILLAGYIALWMPTVPMLAKSAPIVCAVPALAAIFMSGNRSGYLGAVLVGAMLFWNRKGKGMLLVGAIGAIVAFGIIQYGSTKVFSERMRQTAKGNESDDYRRDILWACWDIAIQNPLIGVSPQQLPIEIGRRTSIKHHYGLVESHNVAAHVLAGSGVLCFVAMLAVGYTMWTWKPSDGIIGEKGEPVRDARGLLRMLVTLWWVRGMFTREILYNPSFNIAFGLVIGLCVLTAAARDPAARRTVKA